MIKAIRLIYLILMYSILMMLWITIAIPILLWVFGYSLVNKIQEVDEKLYDEYVYN